MNRILLAASILLLPSLSMAGFWGATTDPSALPKSGGTMTGDLDMDQNSIVNVDTMTITGNAFSVGTSSLVVVGGRVGIGQPSPQASFHLSTGNAIMDGGGYLVSNQPLGEVHISTKDTSATTINTQFVFEEIAGTLTFDTAVSTHFAVVGQGLIYRGALDARVSCEATVSLSAANANDIAYLLMVKNDTIPDENPKVIARKISAAADVGDAFIQGTFTAIQGDKFSVYISNISGTGNFTAEAMIKTCIAF